MRLLFLSIALLGSSSLNTMNMVANGLKQALRTEQIELLKNLSCAVKQGSLQTIEKNLKNNNFPYTGSIKRHYLANLVSYALDAGKTGIASRLVDAGGDVSLPRGKHNRTLLHDAALSGNTDRVAWLLRHKVDINAEDVRGWRALHLAAYRGHVDVVQHLIAKQARHNHNFSVESPLNLAVQEGHLEVVRQLLFAGDKDDLMQIKSADIYRVVDRGDIDMLNFLISKGIRPEGEDRDGCTILHVATLRNRLDVLKTIIDYVPHYVNKQIQEPFRDSRFYTHHGKIPLHFAAAKGNLAAVKLLVEAGSDITTLERVAVFVRKDGSIFIKIHTPLEEAKSCDQIAVVNYLKQAEYLK